MNELPALNRKREKLLRELPPLAEIVRGSLIERHLRCGKASCHCADRGDNGHRVFYLTVSFGGGRTEQITVPIPSVPVVRRWVENYGRWWKAVEEISAINRKLLRERLIETPEAPDRSKRRLLGG